MKIWQKSQSFLEVAFLLIYGDLPNVKSKLDFFVEEITQHSLVHEDVRSILDGFPSKAHPHGSTFLFSIIFNCFLS